jgi:hypothetical protein
MLPVGGLAEEAVTCEPVSPPNSLLTGKNTGNFSVSARFAERDRKFAARNQRLTTEFPMIPNREFDEGPQGIVLLEQGICWRRGSSELS